MKTKEMRSKSASELAVMAGELRQEMMNLRVQQASGQLENPARIQAVRRSIARAETLISEARHKAATK